jgi:hypothetical protein
MKSPPDKLFRDSLEHYSKPAPASAWERIESGLDRKRNRSPWMKIAAGFLLVVATSVLLWQQNQRVSNDQAAKVAELSNEDELKQVDALAPGSLQSEVDSLKSLQLKSIVERSRNNQTHVETENLPVVERSRNEPSGSSGHRAVGRGQSEKPMEEVQIMLVDVPDAKIKEELATIAQVEITNEMAANEIVSETNRTNITYSSEQVNAKFLKQVPAPDATPEKKNTSGLQKVIDRALDLRYEESVLADLREKKNEWLSLNIPSKQREINK